VFGDLSPYDHAVFNALTELLQRGQFFPGDLDFGSVGGLEKRPFEGGTFGVGRVSVFDEPGDGRWEMEDRRWKMGDGLAGQWKCPGFSDRPFRTDDIMGTQPDTPCLATFRLCRWHEQQKTSVEGLKR